MGFLLTGLQPPSPTLNNLKAGTLPKIQHVSTWNFHVSLEEIHQPQGGSIPPSCYEGFTCAWFRHFDKANHFWEYLNPIPKDPWDLAAL